MPTTAEEIRAAVEQRFAQVALSPRPGEEVPGRQVPRCGRPNGLRASFAAFGAVRLLPSNEEIAIRHGARSLMKPITFSCEHTLAPVPEDIVQQILDVTKWPDFHGYGPIPGIKIAEFEVRTPEIVGSRIRVTNTDGSKHVEEIVEWQHDQRLQLHMKDFSAPLSRLATRIEETWEFERNGSETKVTRSFHLHAKSALARPILWLISILLKKAIARHLRGMRTRGEIGHSTVIE
jgi:hypothetical protein